MALYREFKMVAQEFRTSIRDRSIHNFFIGTNFNRIDPIQVKIVGKIVGATK